MRRLNPYQDLGRLLLRLLVGGLLGAYGYHKLTQGSAGLEPVAGWLGDKGLPEVLKYGVYAGRVLAPLLLIIGLFTRLAGLVIVANMGFSLFLAHAHQLTRFNAHGGWAIEQTVIFTLAGLAIALLGAGRYSLDARLWPRRRSVGASAEPAETRLDDVGRLVLRFLIGGLMLTYGFFKIADGGECIALIAEALRAHGLPVAMKYGVYVCEIVAPLMLLTGIFSRIGGVMLATHMGFAILLAHSHQICMVDTHGGLVIERPLSFLVGGIVLALLGAGRYRLDMDWSLGSITNAVRISARA